MFRLACWSSVTLGIVVALAACETGLPDALNIETDGGVCIPGVIDAAPVDAPPGSPDARPPSAFCLQAEALDGGYYEWIEPRIFVQSCSLSTSCHQGSNPPKKLNLEAGKAYDEIVGVYSQELPTMMLVNPGNPDDSYLLLKIGGIACALPELIEDASGNPVRSEFMPADNKRLCRPKIDVVRRWIESLPPLPDGGPADGGIGPDGSPVDAGADAAAASCTDMLANGNETDVDCGGPDCMACGVGLACNMPSDCASMLCSTQCLPGAGCTDLTMNGMETDVDCGGLECSGCMVGDMCMFDSDCLSSNCMMMMCEL